MNNQFTYPKEKIRFAILTFFFAQGLCMASWASRIPDFKDVFAANYAFYWGLILFMIPVGKFVAIPLAGYLVSRLGSRTMVQVSILGYDMVGSCSRLALYADICYHSSYCIGGAKIFYRKQPCERMRSHFQTPEQLLRSKWKRPMCSVCYFGSRKYSFSN